MSTGWRERIRDRHREHSIAVLDEAGTGPETEADYLSELRRNRLDALRSLDPDAGLEEELRLRVLGEGLHGAVDFSWGGQLMKPLQDSVSAAADAVIELQLVGVSAGSTVMHVRPTPKPHPQPSDVLPAHVDATQADAAVRKLLAFTDALESGTDVGRFSKILAAADNLTEVLDRFDLALGLRWYSKDGLVVESRITREGREHAARLRSTQDLTEQVRISGSITELKASGMVKVKAGISRRSQAWEVRMTPEDLLGMRLVIGQNVSFVVTQRRKLDKIGRTHATVYEFVRMDADHMFLGDSED